MYNYPPSHAPSQYSGFAPSHAPSHSHYALHSQYNYELATESISVNLLHVWNLDGLIPVFGDACLLSYEEFPRISVRFLQSLRIPEDMGQQFLVRVSEMMQMFETLSSFGLTQLLRPLLQHGVWQIEQFPDIKTSSFKEWGITKECTELFFFKVSQPQFKSKLFPDEEESDVVQKQQENTFEKAKKREVKELMKFLNTARRGVRLLKYPAREGMFASKGERMFNLQTLQKKQIGDAILSWHKPGKDAKQSLKMVKIFNIRAVGHGLTKEFPKATYRHCFHIQTTDRTLNLQASSQEEQIRWVRNVRLLIKYKEERVQYRRRRRRHVPSSSEESSDFETETSGSSYGKESNI